jgi:hypothetical protein
VDEVPVADSIDHYMVDFTTLNELNIERPMTMGHVIMGTTHAGDLFVKACVDHCVKHETAKEHVRASQSTNHTAVKEKSHKYLLASNKPSDHDIDRLSSIRAIQQPLHSPVSR